MANFKDYGLTGVANTIQLGKQGGTVSYDNLTGRYALKQSNTSIFAAADVGSLTATGGGVIISDSTQRFEIDGTTISKLAANVISLDGDAAVRIPVGNDAARPTGEIGMIRVNTEGNSKFEFYDGNTWSSVSTGGSDGQLQFNSNGSMGGISSTSYDGSKLTLGSNSEVGITGGEAGQMLTTDGTGNLIWSTPNPGTVTSIDFSGGDTGLITVGGPITSNGTITLGGTLNVANGGTGTTTSTGTGSVVLSDNPVLVSPNLGTPTFLDLSNATALNLETGVTGVLPMVNGGTGANVISAGYVTSDGNTLSSTSTIPGSDITGDITGNANNVTGIVTIEHGGTGANTATAAFDALAPTTTTGDIIYYNGNTNVRLGIGAETQVLTVANGVPTWAPGGGGGGGTPGGLDTQIQFNDAGTFGGTANLTFDKTTSTFTIGGDTVSNTSITGGTITTATISSQSDTNLALVPGANGIVTIAAENGGATGVELGTPAQGQLVSNAVALTTESTVSDAIAQLNQILGKLVPPSPPNFPAGQTLSINSLATYRMTNYVQTDNTPAGNKSVAGGTTVTNVLRTASYTTSNITNAGPGDSGTVTAWVNGANTGSRTLTSSINGNGTYNNLVIFNNADYNTVNSSVSPGFWYVFSARSSGTVTQGWNEVRIGHSTTANTNTPSWFYDSSSPGTPQFTSTSITANSVSLTYSSTVPHYNSSTSFAVQFNVNRLSGNTYPTTDTFVTGTAGGAFSAPTSVTYATAGVTTPLAPNLYVASGSHTVNTAASIISGFGSSSSGPSVSVNNSYATGSTSFNPGATVLYKTGTTSSASRIEETNIFVGSSFGVGSGLAFRIINPGSTNTPTFTANAPAFDSQTSTLETYDATVVANVLKHDVTNYSTGYLPAGPNLSSGRSGTQYFTFKIIRSSVSKFDIGFTGTVAGMWVALPGSIINNTSTLNGWIDMSVAYAGAGAPGANIGAGGNGSNGCALGGPVPLNSAQSNRRFTCTFGTVSSSDTATNEIYIRIALTSGQSVTALTLQTASN